MDATAEGGPGPATILARRRRKKIIAVLVALAVIGGGWFTWDFVIRPRTVREVLEGGPYRPGTEVRLAGTVTQVYQRETSYGRLVSLGLDGYPECPGTGSGVVRGDPTASYKIGDRFETVLHFGSYRLNGNDAVWAPELMCWFPSTLTSIGDILDAMSYVAGIALMYTGTDSNGWAMYEIATPWAMPVHAEALPVTLRKSISLPPNHPDFPRGTIDSGLTWKTFSGVQYVLVAAMFSSCPIVDEMSSFSSPTSRNGTLRHADVNGNGLVDDGDRLDIRLPPTTSDNAYDTYLLQIGEANGTRAAYAYSARYILNGPQGPVETLPISRTDPHAILRHSEDAVDGRVTTTLEVHRVTSGNSPPIGNLTWSLHTANGTRAGEGLLTDLPSTLLYGITLSFDDLGAEGQLDAGDRFIVGNLSNQSRVFLEIVKQSPQGFQMASVQWIAGYGPIVPALSPEVTLTPTGSNPYRVDVDISFWFPELVLNRSIRVSLWEGSLPVLAGVALVNGTVGTFTNGTLSFTDADGDGSLSSGDSFTVQVTTPARYQLAIYILFDARLQDVLFGP
jgi:hypothetical protein